MAVVLWLLWSLLICRFTTVQAFSDTFHEELFLKTLPTKHLYTHFQFTTVSDQTPTKANDHYKLFPKSFGQIIHKFEVMELHFSLTHGRWRHKIWGYPITSVPYGVELWAWFSPKLNQDSIDSKWSGLVNALSGQFCASLNYLQKSVSVSPQHTFKPMGLWPVDHANSSSYLRHGVLPREMVCTENLTPWRKLLPCESKAGLATLLSALHLYEASFHSIGMHLRSICKDESCLSTQLELKQTLSSVYDPAVANVQEDENLIVVEGWSFRAVFGEALTSTCPLAVTSKVIVALPQTDSGYNLKLVPEEAMHKRKYVEGAEFSYAVYDLKDVDFTQDFNLIGTYFNTSDPGIIKPPSITAHRYATGYGEEKGGVVSIISNEHETKAVQFVYFDVVPWYIPVNLHSLRVEKSGERFRPDFVSFTPAKDRVRPTSIEMVLTIPPKSALKLTYSFRRSFLKWTEHPPDSHHGHYIGSALISVILPASHNLTGISERCTRMSGDCVGHSPLFTRIHTESLLVILPTPDFSMPFNVICLTCTILAIGFGSMLNLTTRNFYVVSSTKSGSFKDRLKSLVAKLFKAKTS